MNNYSDCIAKLRTRILPDECQIEKLWSQINNHQRSVMSFCMIETKSRIMIDSVRSKITDFPKLNAYLCIIFPDVFVCELETLDSNLTEILRKLSNRLSIGYDLFSYVMNGIMNKNVDDWFVGLFLAIIYAKGISDDDIYNMTLAMRDTGKIHDYRDIFIPKKLIRRYPTGALSEKTALLLPAMLQAASNDYPLCSAFTIGKSLSFTGGTWSKLGVINGFTFPKPGDETITTLHMCNIAMTVAQDSLCPVDTILYQIRGYTDTVNSVPLAASSIASKQLACPATLLLLDVRYGNGAFFEKTFADQLCLKIKTILAREGLDMISSMLPTDQPNGSSIGNHIEVCEAIAIMKNDEKHFNKEGLSEQKEILINFFAKLMSTTFPKKNENEWRNYGQTLIENYCLLSSFSSICKAHGVAENEIESLFNSPFDYFKLRKIGEIRSDTCGEFVDINQKRLGNISNFIFSNSAGVNSDPNNCLNFNLKMRCGSIVKKNDLLCTIYSNNDVELSGEEINEIYSIFSISN